MANSIRFGIELPDEGADSDQWGNILNNAFSALEQRVTDRQNGDTVQSNLSVNGTFNVTGNTVLGDALTDTTTVNGNASVTGNLSVNGNVTLGDAAGDTVTVPGSLSVNGNVTLGDALTDTATISGNATVAGNFNVNGNTTIGNASTDTLTVHPSAVTYQNAVTHSNNHTFSGNVSVQGNTVLGDSSIDTLTVNPASVTWANPVTHSNNHTFSGNVSVQGNTVLGDALTDTTTVNGSASVTSNLSVSGSATLGDSVSDSHISNGRFEFVGPVQSSVVSVSVLQIDTTQGNYFTKTINADSAFTFANPPNGKAYSFMLKLVQTSGNVTWPSTVRWPDDVSPTLIAGKTHLFVFVTDNGGGTWRGAFSLGYSA